MGTFANSEDSDEMCGISSGSTLLVRVKKNLQTK